MMLLAIPSLFAGIPVALYATFVGRPDAYVSFLHLTPVGGVGLVFAILGLVVALGLHVTGGGGGLVSALSPIGALIRLGLVDRTYDFVYRQAQNVALGVGWFDRYVIDGLVNATGGITLFFGRWARFLQTGRVSDYVYAVVAGLVLLAAWGHMFWLVP